MEASTQMRVGATRTRFQGSRSQIALSLERLSRVDPIGFKLRWSHQGLHNNTILFRLFLQTAQLLRCCLRRINVESEPNCLEANRDIRCNAERASKIQISFDGHLDTFCGYSHRSGHHLASKLCAG